MKLIQAAGGLLERTHADALQIALVHRRRYAHRDGSFGDWVLPKGKADGSESVEETALREVLEETGCQAQILGPIFCCEYLSKGLPKIVRFYRMACLQEGTVQDDSEVMEIEWMTPPIAHEQLTYEREQVIVREAYPEHFADDA